MAAQGHHFPAGRVAKATWRPSKAAWESPTDTTSLCHSGVLWCLGGAECCAEHLASYENQMSGAGESLTPPAATPRLGEASGTGGCPQTQGELGALGVSLCPSKQKFQRCFCLFYLLMEPPCPRSLPTTKGLLRQGLCQPQGSCLRRRQPDVSVDGPLGNTFKEMKALLSLHCENTVTTSLRVSCSLFKKYFAILLLLSFIPT